MDAPKGYNCLTCHKRHDFSMYIRSHPREVLQHTCDLCGAVTGLTCDLGDGERTPYQVKPGEVPERQSQFGLTVEERAQLELALSEPQVTEWFEDGVPPCDGYWHIRFANGTEADRNWYWQAATYSYHFDKESAAAITPLGIAWRGLDRDPA